jgi:acylphosphatase
MSTTVLHAIIHGRVQGVFFRASARREAARLGVGGWVRNLADGSVETRAEGPEDRLRAYLDWLHRGPEGARVDRVEEEWTRSDDPPTAGFTVTG